MNQKLERENEAKQRASLEAFLNPRMESVSLFQGKPKKAYYFFDHSVWEVVNSKAHSSLPSSLLEKRLEI